MLRTWRIVPALSSGLLVVAGVLSALVVVESGAARVADSLGYAGQTIRLIAIPDDPDGEDGRGLVHAITALAEDERVAVAYSQSYGTGLVTVLDEDGRFRGGGEPLVDGLGVVGAGPTALVSDAPESAASLTPVLGAGGGIELVGTFTSDVMFEQRYPVVLVNVDARPFAEGVYLFAGDGILDDDRGFTAEVTRLFDDHGMAVLDVAAADASTSTAVAMDALQGPYGIVLALFGVVAVMTQLVVLVVRAALSADRWLAAAVLGLTRSGVRALVWWGLMRQVLVGLAAGGGAAVVVVLAAGDLSLVSTGERLAVVPPALLVGLVVCAAASWVAGAREGRRVARAVPC